MDVIDAGGITGPFLDTACVAPKPLPGNGTGPPALSAATGPASTQPCGTDSTPTELA